jgi:hypothetical protein
MLAAVLDQFLVFSGICFWILLGRFQFKASPLVSFDVALLLISYARNMLSF